MMKTSRQSRLAKVGDPGEPMLNKLTVHGFKSIERQTIALGALNLLIGANGSGKSNLLVALSFFKNSVLGKPDVLVKQLGGAASLLFHGKKTTKAATPQRANNPLGMAAEKF
jgi:predicted ATPase